MAARRIRHKSIVQQILDKPPSIEAVQAPSPWKAIPVNVLAMMAKCSLDDVLADVRSGQLASVEFGAEIFIPHDAALAFVDQRRHQ